jgi:choline dehydrogenase-like flavoprotein
MAGIIKDESRYDEKRGFVAGYELETLPAFGMPGYPARSRSPVAGAANTPATSRRTATSPGMWLVGEDMPQESNRVTLNGTVKDQLRPARRATCTSTITRTTSRCASTAWNQSSRCTSRSARVKVFKTPPYPSTHNMGTCRMSEKARDGVVNRWGQTHDVKNLFVSDGSQFTTGASENPTLTIVALALRQADYIAGEMARGNL